MADSSQEDRRLTAVLTGSDTASIDTPFPGEHYCGQYLLGPDYVTALRGWRRHDIATDLKLTLHPDLGFSRATGVGKSLAMIGYMVDPAAPAADDATICRTLLARFDDFDTLIRATAAYGGRWIIIARQGDRRLMFHDALGLRQIFFTPPDSGLPLWVGSQPGLLAWHLQLQVSREAADFMASPEFRAHDENRWPGNRTAFREITHLLPNHHLNLDGGEVRRYWPLAPLAPIDLEIAVPRICERLTGLVSAFANRFDAVLGMTAGLDSRMVLSAARALGDRLRLITVRQKTMPDKHADLVIAARLARRIGADHSVIAALPAMSDAFSAMFRTHCFSAHEVYGGDIEAIRLRYGRQKAVMTGSGAEVAREPFRKRIDANKPFFTAGDLAFLQRMGEHPFALDAYTRWLADSRARHGVHLLDLFSWEQAHGNWLAATQAEFDLAWREIFTPFNCRQILIDMLSVEEKHRLSPDHRLFHRLIGQQWPELLAEPVNPAKSRPLHQFRKTARRLLARLCA